MRATVPLTPGGQIPTAALVHASRHAPPPAGRIDAGKPRGRIRLRDWRRVAVESPSLTTSEANRLETPPWVRAARGPR